MKQIKGIILVVFLFMVCFQEVVGKTTSDNISFPAYTGPVVDEAKLLTLSQQEELVKIIENIPNFNLAVVTLEDTHELSIEQYAHQLLHTWQLGYNNSHRGVLFVINPKIRKTRIETDTGSDRILNHSISGQILDKHVIPYFKQGDLSTGIISGTHAIANHLTRPASVSQQTDSADNAYIEMVLGFSLFLGILSSILFKQDILILRQESFWLTLIVAALWVLSMFALAFFCTKFLYGSAVVWQTLRVKFLWLLIIYIALVALISLLIKFGSNPRVGRHTNGFGGGGSGGATRGW